jgi:hypothetical protein
MQDRIDEQIEKLPEEMWLAVVQQCLQWPDNGANQPMMCSGSNLM